MIEGVEILFSLTSNTTSREQLVTLKSDGYKTIREGEHFIETRSSVPQGADEHSRIQTVWFMWLLRIKL